MKLASPSYQAIAHELDSHKISHHVEYGSKHPAVVFTFNGHPYNVFFSLTAKDWRAPKQSRAFVRRILRQPTETA